MTGNPADFERRVIDVHGVRGQTWLTELPARIQACAQRWSITVHAPFATLSYNWVAPATTHDGTSVVLKLGVPCAELSSELAALRAWNGAGTAHLLAGDADQGALLLEHLQPGAPLTSVPDEQATTIALALMQQLHRSPLPDVPTLATWTSGLERAQLAGFSPSLVDRALSLRNDLLASAPPPVLLHGDLHHANILSSQRQPWLAFDPKGLLGDPAYEPASFLYNPRDRILDDLDAAFSHLIPRRIDQLTEHFDRSRLLAWAFVQSILSAWWSFSDHAEYATPSLRFAERLPLAP